MMIFLDFYNFVFENCCAAFSTNLIRRWTTGKRGKRGNKVHGDCQSNLVRCLSYNFIPSFSPFSTFSSFPVSVLLLPLSSPSPFEGKRQKHHFCSFSTMQGFGSCFVSLIDFAMLPSELMSHFSGMLSTNEK